MDVFCVLEDEQEHEAVFLIVARGSHELALLLLPLLDV